jgi:hypothetical protein
LALHAQEQLISLARELTDDLMFSLLFRLGEIIMNYLLKVALAGAAMILTKTSAAAATYTEDFEAFASWESN